MLSPTNRGRRTTKRLFVAFQTLALLASLVVVLPVSAVVNTALQLNGTSQYATLGATTQLRSATFTVELWFKRTGAGVGTSTGTGGVTAIPLIAKGRAEGETAAADVNYFFGIDSTSGKLVGDFEEGASGASPSLNHPITGTAVIAANSVWHHAAATYDGTTWNLYLDGVLDGTLSVGRPANAANTNLTSVGSALLTTGTAAGFFAGAIDEVRIWNVARSLAQINATKDVEITAGQANLLGVWNLNEGTSTVLNDSSGNSITGAAVGSPTWVPGFVPPPPNSAPVATADSYDTPRDLTFNVSAPGVLTNDTDVDGNPLTAILNTTVSHGALTLNANGSFAYTPTGGYTGPDSFAYHANDGTANSNVVTVSLTIHPPGATALQLNGTTQNATLGTASQLRSATFTLELWFKRTGAGVGTNTGNGGIASAIPLITKGRAEGETPAQDVNYFFGIDANSGKLVADFEEAAGGALPSGNHPITGTAVIAADGVWHHAAATYDGTTWNLYLDGSLDGTLSVGQPANAATSVLTSVGTARDTTGTPLGFFAGAVDEVRIWNVARSLVQINATKDSEITVPTTNLLGRWGLNEGYGSGLADSSGNSILGAAVGSPTWVPGFVPPPPPNTAPVAVADSYSTPHDVTLTVAAPGVLGNDSDADADPLTANLDANVSHGTLTLNANGSVSYVPTPGYIGPDSFTYHANDGTVDSNIVTVSLTVTNAAPVAVADSYTTPQDSTLTVPAPGVLTNDSDADADPLTAILDANVSHGTLTLNTNGSVSYVPTPGYIGPDSFTYHANDGTVDSNVVTVSLTVDAPGNTAPVAVADSYSTPHDVTLTVAAPGVLGNDSDADADPLTANLDANVSHGTLTLNANGSVSYVPTPGYIGPDSFTYHANDGTVDSNIVTVSLTVTNAAPVAVADSYTTPQDSTLTVPAPGVLTNDSDADADPLTAILDANVSHGTLTLNTNGSVSYVPTPGYIGPDSFTYHANDGTVDSNIVTVSLTVTNAAPVAVADSYSTPQNVTLTVVAPGVLGNDSDADADPLTAILNVGVAHGTLTLNANGSVSYVPTPGYIGPDSFTYHANDGTANSNVVTVTLTVTPPPNTAPVAAADSYSTPQNTTLSVAAPGVLANDSDADADPLTAVLNADVAHGTLTLNTNGSFAYTPTGGYTGPDSFTYHANDGTANSNIVTVSLTVGTPTNMALQLNGSSQYATLGTTTQLRSPTFTVELWFKRTGAGVGTSTGTGGIPGAIPLIAKGRAEAETAAADINYFLGIDATSGKLVGDFEEAQTGTTPGLNHPISGTAVIAADGVWHHAAATYDGTTWNLYLDGVLDGTLSVGQPANAASTVMTSVGSAVLTTGTPSGFFAGATDEVRVWSVARSLAQINATKNSEITVPTANLLGRWGLNEGTGTVLNDSSGNSITGAAVGSPTWVPGFVPPAGNGAPNAPTLNAPANGGSGIGTSPTLSVGVSDPDANPLTVTFFGRPIASGNFAQIAQHTGVVSGTTDTATWASLGAGQQFEWYVTVGDGIATTTGPTWTFTTTASADPVFVGAGDIASCAVTEDTATGNVLAGIQGNVFTVGDNVYDFGTAAEFTNCYAPTPWGSPGVKSRTRPVPGNHDWASNNLDGYNGYFGAAATDANGKSYYSYNIASSNWHIVNLDSECQLVTGGCAAGSAQELWLKADLAANSTKNVIAIWHKPRYSSGATNNQALQPFWDDLYAAGADILLDGHDHIYERFSPMKSGATLADPPVADPTYGIQEFNVGTGGEGHHSIATVLSTSVVRDATTFGIFKLTLHATTYDWVFLPIAGSTFTDSGSGSVHAAPPAPPTSLIAYWAMDETSGSIAHDTGALPANDATTVASPTWVPGRIGNALQFNGTTQYATTPDGNDLDITTAITIAAWVKPEKVGSSNIPQQLVQKAATGGTNGYEIGLTGATSTAPQKAYIRFNEASNGDAFRVTSTTLYPTNGTTWIHIAGTWDGTTIRFYYNGVAQGTPVAFAGPIVANTRALSLGGPATFDASRLFKGAMDDVRVYNRALSPAEIASLASPVVNGAPNAPTLNAPANGGSGIGTSPTLSVGVSDPDANPLTVTFFGRPIASGNFAQIAQHTGVVSGTTDTATWASLGAGQQFEWYVTVSDGIATTIGPTWTFNTTASADPVFVGAGDIASCAVTEDTATGNVLAGIQGNVFTVGDNVYDFGTAAEFTNCYAPTPWGSPGVKSRTRPVPGNHDWASNNLDGYNGYFGAAATDANGKSYYSYNIASSNWHIVNLDSECQLVTGGCAAGSAQELWLKADLAANSTKNVIAIWHKPRYSSGATNNQAIQPFWDDLYAAGADIVLDGHDHIYERFTPMKSGATLADPPVADPTYGIQEFNVGTGGEGHHSIATVLSTSVVRDATTFGIFKLTLHATTYDWVFLPIAGSTFTDSGSGSVHAAPPPANTAPVATADSYSTAQDATLTVAAPGVLTNDTDADADPLTAILNVNVLHGTLTLAANGGFGYVPTSGYNGPDSFTYHANDGTADSNIVTVTLTVGTPTNMALQLNGSSQYATLGTTTQLRSATFTVELWFKRTGAGVGTSTGTGGIPGAIPLIAKGRAEAETAAADINYFLGIDATSGKLVGDFEEAQTGTTPGLNHPISGTAVIAADGVWHHAAATYDGTTWNLYLDGVLDGTLSVGQPANAASTVLTSVGSAVLTTGTPSGFFAGATDEVRVWSVARSLAQINATKNSEITVPTANLLGRWGLNEGTSTVLNDSSGNSITGAAVGSPTWVPGFVPPAGNGAPNAPTLNAPANGGSGIGTSPTLSVGVSDPDANPLTVTFFGRPIASGNFAQIAQHTGVVSGTTDTATWASLGAGQQFEWYVTVSDGIATTIGPTWTFNTTASADPVFVGAGDIASCAVTEDTATGNVLAGIQGNVFTVGDNVYDFGTAAEFTNCYAPTPWGSPGVKSRTRPVPGNHDWASNNLDGYNGYFGAAATDANGKSYYSYNIASSNWHIVNLDSECQLVTGGCAAGSAQELWLKADLAANSTKNVIAIWHKPRYSSGATNNQAIQPFWDDLYAAGADIVLDGHDHIYERFTPMKSGATLADPPVADPTYGIQEFNVGTGGEGHHSIATVLSTSVVRDATTFGIFKLTLHATTYDWVFLPIAGSTFTDSGSGSVHAAPPAGNTAPVAVADSYSTPRNVTLNVAAPGVLANDTDADGNALTAILNVNVLHGTLTLNANGGFGYVPTSGYTGPDSFTYHANDGTANSTVVTVTLTVTLPANTAPVATADSYSTPQNVTLNVAAPGVLANDSDADGNPLTAILNVTVLHGTLTLNANGGFGYVPTAGYNGPDSFTYHANDGTANSNIVTVSLTVTPAGNTAPVAVADSYSTPRNVTLNVAAPGVLANDTDADGNALTAILNVNVLHGTLTLNANGGFGYVPTSGYNGPDSFTYHANDGTANSTVVTVTLTVTLPANTAPVATADSYSTPQNVTLNVAAPGVLANDTDADANPLTAILNVTVTHGTLTLNANGGFGYVPTAGYNGPDSFTYHANDGTANSNIVTVSLTVTPSAAASLIAYWAMDETSGSIAHDTGALPANDATTIASPTWVPGRIGNALQFNGTTQYATTPDSNDLDITTAITIAAWVKPEKVGSSNIPQQLVQKAATGGTNGYEIGLTGATSTAPQKAYIRFNEASNGDAFRVTSTTLYPTNGTTWIHIAGTWDGTTIRFYYNGVAQGTPVAFAGPIVANTRALSLGGPATFDASRLFKGAMDDVRVYNRALSPSEIATLASASTSNTAPVATADSYSTPQNVTLNVAAPGVLANDSDADGNPLTAILNVTVLHGTLTLNANGSFGYVPTAGYTGPDSFTYHANDGTANSNIVTVSLTVTPAGNTAPVAVADSYSTPRNVTLNVAAPGVLANDTDADGNALTAILNVNVLHGTLTLNANGGFGYVPTSGYTGPDSFTYHANDGTANSTVVTVTLTVTLPANTAPVATADSYSTPQNVTLNVAAPGVLANDSDADGNPLTAILNVTVLHGTLTLNANGSFGYVPTAGYNGPDSFTYHANDGTANSNIVTVSLTVTPAGNTAPVAVADSYSTPRNVTLNVAAPGVLANDTDADGNALTAILNVNVLHGTLTLNANGGFGYVPTSGYNGPDSFTYHANDGTANSTVVTVTLTVTLPANTAPVATADSYSTPQNVTLNVAAPGVLANDTDADANPLTAILNVTVTHGTLTLNANGGFGYVPTAGYNGPDSFTYHANDGTANSNIVTVSLTVTPSAAASLIAYWAMDETSGSIAHDTGALPANDATTIASPTWVPGRIGNALQFNGTTQYATTPDSNDLDITTAITIAAWVKPEKVGSSNIPQQLVQKAATGGTNGYEIGLTGATSTAPQKAYIRFNEASNGDAFRVTSTTLYPTNGTTWIHIAGTWDGTTIRFYYNGVAQGTPVAFAGPIVANTRALSLGGPATFDASRLFKGAMDDVRVYNRALSPSEIASLASGSVAILSPLSVGVAASPLDKGVGLLAHDPAAGALAAIANVGPILPDPSVRLTLGEGSPDRSVRLTLGEGLPGHNAAHIANGFSCSTGIWIKPHARVDAMTR